MPGIKGIQEKRIKTAPVRSLKTNRETWLEELMEDGLGSPGIANLGGSFHPSSLGNPCDRFLYLHYRGLLPAQEIPAKLQRIFDHGNVAQTRFEEYFSQLRLYRSREVRAYIDSPPIHGRADILLEIPDIGEYLVEVKTINDRGFGELKEAKMEHSVQLQIYLNILDVDRGCVLYENKNNQEIKIFRQDKQVSMWKSLIRRCNAMMKMTTLPSLESVVGIHDDRFCRCLGVKDG